MGQRKPKLELLPDVKKHEIRAPRFEVIESFKDLELLIEGEAYEIVNISESGLLIEKASPEQQDPPASGNTTITFKGGEIIYNGVANVIWQKELDARTQYGLYLPHQLSEGSLQAIQDMIEVKAEILADFNNYLNLPAEYVQFVSKLRTYLATIKKSLVRIICGPVSAQAISLTREAEPFQVYLDS